MMRGLMLMLAALAVLTGGVADLDAASLRGSRAAMEQQNAVARSHGLQFYHTSAEIRAAVDRGELVPLPGNEDYAVAAFVSHPFTQPAVRLFVERLSAQYRAACGQKLVVTSAVRAGEAQPRNAHALSVHPAGMAVDLRVSDRAACRSWLEDALLGLERRGVLNGIRENHPPHYHVAIFPEPYLAYAAEQMAAEPVAVEAVPAAAPPAPQEVAALPAEAAERGTRLPLAATLMLLAFVPLGGHAWRRYRR